MAREISSGGVVIRAVSGVWHVALIEPRKDDDQESQKLSKHRPVLALPKGLVDAGETTEAAAIREVKEETGIIAVPITKLTDIRYVYLRTWSDNERVFKVVSFYLLLYQAGTIDDIAPEMRIEVKRSLWVPLTDARGQLAYSNERKVVQRAQEYLQMNRVVAAETRPA